MWRANSGAPLVVEKISCRAPSFCLRTRGPDANGKAMTTRKRTVVASSLLALLVGSIGVACGSDTAEMPAIPDGSAPTSTTPPPPPPVEAGGDAADAAALVGLPPPEAPKPNELTEPFGIFVSKGAPDGGDGTRAKPFNTISAGLEQAATDKKRLYVCAGTYPEAIELKNGVSVIANLSCVDPLDWKLNGARTTLNSPTSPAVRAEGIALATRIDGLEVIAPPGTDAERSSIGLLATDSVGLTFTDGKLEAQRGADGQNAVAPNAYSQVDRPAEQSRPSSPCIAGLGAGSTCRYNPGTVLMLARPEAGLAQGGQVTCVATGAPQLTGTGGSGGTGRLYIADGTTVHELQVPGGPGIPSTSPTQPLPGASGQAGTFGVNGYSTADGQPGNEARAIAAGGAGGLGGFEFVAQSAQNFMRFASSGSGGGAGGCPGRAAPGAHGGGASIAVLAIRSPVRFEKMGLRAANGGAGGRGSFGAAPTSGQMGATSSVPLMVGSNGAPGVQAGPSGHGAGGPSIAIVYDSAAPIQVDCQIAHGAAGISPPEQTQGGVFPGQPTLTIPAAAAARAADTFRY